MSKSKKIGLSFSAGKIILIIIATILMFGSRYVPVAGLPESGVQILGILIGGMILWLSMGVGWTSRYVLFALSTVPILGAAKVCTTSFGNATTVLMLYCFMIAACLTKSGFARRIAIVLIPTSFPVRVPGIPCLCSLWHALYSVSSSHPPALSLLLSPSWMQSSVK